MTLELVSLQPEDFDQYFNSLKPDVPNREVHQSGNDKFSKLSSSRNPWFNEFWEHHFDCQLTTSSMCTDYQLNETNWDSKLQFIVDATYVFAHALHDYLHCSPSSCPDISSTDINGEELFKLILAKTFYRKFDIDFPKYCSSVFIVLTWIKFILLRNNFILFFFPSY